MSFVPAIPATGYAGWAFLKRTEVVQRSTLENQPMVKRDEAYFRENIARIETADQLVADKRLLRVALGAFGLEGDVNNTFFIRKVLTDGTSDPAALAMKLSDRRYREFSAAFGLGQDSLVPGALLPGFADQIISRWKDQQFEISVGKVNESYRLALNAGRELDKIATSSMSADAKWFSVMGQPPLRKVMETAFGLPASFGTLDIDQQKQMFENKARAAFGTPGIEQFGEPDRMNSLIRRYLVRAQLQEMGGAMSSGSAALTLLQTAATRSRRSV